MIFYLGTHHPNWLEKTDVPLMVSHRTLKKRKGLPRALGPWVLDSGAFSEIKKHGRWTERPCKYAAAVERYMEIGNLQWAAPQDWMCEPFMLARTGYTVHDHQMLTMKNFLELTSIAPHLPWIPVLQGWKLGHYLHHVHIYKVNGVDLTALPVVGLGSVCRRQATGEIARIVRMLSARGLRLHGFGMKLGAFRSAETVASLVSADSMAWSFNGRRNPPMEGCVGHKNCANCLRYALAWREKIR